MMVYENMVRIKAGIGVKIVDFGLFASSFSNVHYHAEVNLLVVKCRIILVPSAKQISQISAC